MNFIIVIVNLLYFYSVFCYKVINSFAKKEKKVINCLHGHNKYVTTLKKIYIPNVGNFMISQGITADEIKLWKSNY